MTTVVGNDLSVAFVGRNVLGYRWERSAGGDGKGEGIWGLEFGRRERVWELKVGGSELHRNWPCGALTWNTCFVGLARDQFCRYLGEKAFSYCGER